MISFKQQGDFSITTKYLNRIKRPFMKTSYLEKYGKMGVAALSSATPVDTGKTSKSWYYKIITGKDGSLSINFYNSNINEGVPIAIILQYGHGTGTGGWVEGRDYINPAIRPIFDKIAREAWEEVIQL